MKNIHLWGVKQNNLKNIDVKIPLGSMTVICGPSGSGKSSLAFQTLYAEGQRRYIESLSNYAKQFLNKAPKPDIQGVTNIPPAISIEQRNGVKTSRSTVGTTTEILDYFRLLYEKIAQPHCPHHEVKIHSDTVSDATKKVLEDLKGERGFLLCPMREDRQVLEGKKLHSSLLKDGFLRIYIPPKSEEEEISKKSKKTSKKNSAKASSKKKSVKKKATRKKSRNVRKKKSTSSTEDLQPIGSKIFSERPLTKKNEEGKIELGQTLDLSSPELIKSGLPDGDFYLVIDRMAFIEKEEGRIADSISQCYQAYTKYNEGSFGGHAVALTTTGKTLKLSEENSCSICGFTFPELNSQFFSFNSPTGACEPCKGFGNTLELDEEKVIPNAEKSISEGCIHPFTMPSAEGDKKELLGYCKLKKIDTSLPWAKLSKETKEVLWNGDENFFGIKGLFDYLETKKYKMHVRVFLSRYKSPKTCSHCKGSRINSLSDFVTIKEKSISDISSMTIEKLLKFMKTVRLSASEKEIGAEILKQIISRLQFLVDVGVHYLTLGRETRTLSGGEYQRLNLANQLGMKLSQTLYVLDEPTVGLHPRDNDRLVNILRQINELGNTLVIVEHDKDVINASNHIIEMGPGSGHLGGEVLFNGLRNDFYSFDQSNTSKHLQVKTSQKLIEARPTKLSSHRYVLELLGCTGRNLKNIDVRIPVNRFVTVTGVSGSGKSSLIMQTLYPALAKKLDIEHKKSLHYEHIGGFERLQNVLMIDQSPIGKSSRSNPVTYLKIYDAIRNIMSSTTESKSRGYTPGTFSLNVDGGRCPTCQGTGVEVIEMPFMDDIEITCDYCDGKKFRDEVLDITYKGRTIVDILNLTVTEAMDFFVAYPNIRRPLTFLKEVGLEYIRLGQSAKTLSGGESQRLKIAREFNQTGNKDTLYILDEPTTGLHFREVQLLLNVLNKLVDAGGTVIVIEHNLDVIAASDYIIDIGPEAGYQGGEIVAQGTLKEILKQKKSITSQYLGRHLGL